MSSAYFTADYVAPSLEAASRLIGKRIVHFERLARLAPEPPAALDYGSLLIECDDGFRLLIVDELQQANLIARPIDDTAFAYLEDDNRYWTPIFDANAPASAQYGWPFQQPIDTVERVFIVQEPGDFLHGELCGLRLTTRGGEQVTLGLSLTGESGGIIEVFRADMLREDEEWRDDLGFDPIQPPESANSA
ncbi:MAG TPA: hypothetical protein VM869_04590 [Enhygromyxa sp.]|nr:hypothetical protein [Enhygromyxa sp.]